MVVRGLDKFLNDSKLLTTEKLSVLKGSRLGIDGPHWLRKIQKAQSEPLVMAMGGIPLGIGQAIEKELQGFKEAGISPYFVFNGLSTIRKDKPFSAPDKRPEGRAEAWGLYNKEQHEAAYGKWAGQSKWRMKRKKRKKRKRTKKRKKRMKPMWKGETQDYATRHILNILSHACII